MRASPRSRRCTGSAIATARPDGSTRARPRRLSALTARILAPNILALAVLVAGVLYLDRYRDGLIATRMEALAAQGELIAGAVAESAVGGGDEPSTFDVQHTEFIIRRLAVSARVRVRLFDSLGRLVADSRQLLGRLIERAPLPPPDGETDWGEKLWHWYDRVMPRLDTRNLRLYRERVDQQAGDYPEVLEALIGNQEQALRRLPNGGLYLSVAVPVQRLRQVHGALLLTSEGEDIDRAVHRARIAILQAFLIALCVTVLLSLFLARTIAGPLRHLAAVAEQVRRRPTRPVAIPDLTRRNDEIGDLSAALSEMTKALYARLDSIAGFAADVAHELKNPLTSLRSAVETLPTPAGSMRSCSDRKRFRSTFTG